MLSKLERLATVRRRKYLYRVSWSLLGLCGVYGVLTGEQIAALLLVAAAVLGVADGHTDPRSLSGQPASKAWTDEAGE